MSDWAPKRFWTSADIRVVEGGFEIVLDSRPVRTPLKSPLVVPSKTLAERIAAEWDAQEAKVNPATMPATRITNSAIDKVMAQMPEIVALLSEYGGTDLLCYRATGPEELIARQAEAWDPLLDWADRQFGAQLRVTSGVMPIAQDPAAISAFVKQVERFSAFELAAFYELVSLSGSLVIALAAETGHLPASDLWERARADEAWQIDIWGADDEAERVNQLKRGAFLQAANYLNILREP